MNQNQLSGAASSPSLISIYSTPPKLQNFSLPENIIFYISKNPSTANVYNKCINSCKYFYLNHPLIVLEDLTNVRLWKYWLVQKINGFSLPSLRESPSTKWNIKQLPEEKLWIYGSLTFTVYITPYYGFSSLIPKIYRSEITKLDLRDQIITFDEFKIFVSSGFIQNLELHHSLIKNLDGSILTIEKIIKMLPNLKIFYCIYNPENYSHLIKSETAKALIEISHFNNMESFSIECAPEVFNFIAFFDGLKKPIKMNIKLEFYELISDNYKLQINNFVLDLIENAPNTENRTPYLYYHGMDETFVQELNRLHKLKVSPK